MQIHELNNFTGELGADSFLAIDDGNDTGKISVEDLLADPVASIQRVYDVLGDRINNIIAGGTAPSAAEVTDARTGVDGVAYGSLGDAIRIPVSYLNGAINALTEIYKGAKPMSYSITSHRITIVSAFYTVKNNILKRVILLRIATDAISSANTWTIGNIAYPSIALEAVTSASITYNAVSLDGGDISPMTFIQTGGGSGNFQLVTTSGISAGQGGLILLTHDQAISSTTLTPFEDTEYPQDLFNKTLLSEDLFDPALSYNGKAWHIADAQLKTLGGYSFIQCRVQGGSSIKVLGMSQSMSTYGYAIRNASGTVIASGGESDGMIIDVPDDGYLLIFSYSNADTIKLIPYIKKKVVVLGDSWSDNDPDHTTYTKWTTLLERDGNYKTFVYAQNGSSISGDTPNYGLNGNVEGQMQQLESDGLKNIDYVIIFGGINDFRGTVSNPYVYNKIASFYSRLNAMFPTARIIYIANNQIYITQQQLTYFHEIVDYLRTWVGMEAYTTFGWVSPGHYLSDHVHVDDYGYKDLYANILSILNGGCINTMKTYFKYNSATTTVEIWEDWINERPKYSAKLTASSSDLGNTITLTLDANDGNLLASVPFCKLLNKAYVNALGIQAGILSCEVAETFTTVSRLNTTNEIKVIIPSSNAGIYLTDNYN